MFLYFHSLSRDGTKVEAEQKLSCPCLQKAVWKGKRNAQTITRLSNRTRSMYTQGNSVSKRHNEAFNLSKGVENQVPEKDRLKQREKIRNDLGGTLVNH